MMTNLLSFIWFLFIPRLLSCCFVVMHRLSLVPGMGSTVSFPAITRVSLGVKIPQHSAASRGRRWEVKERKKRLERQQEAKRQASERRKNRKWKAEQRE